MININTLSKAKYIYFIGIGGCNMSGLAMMLYKRGYKVKGSDRECNSNLDSLKEAGIEVEVGHREGNIDKDVQLIVYTVAIPKNNPELIKGRSLGIPVIDRGELLGSIMELYSNSIAISGTHGKTTTSSMIALMLETAKYDPTITIGGTIPNIGNNYKIGSGPYFVAEACEYYESFLHFKPSIGVVLNIEEEHTDYFSDMKHIVKSFTKFMNKIKPDGLLVICNDCKNNRSILPTLDKKYVTYAVENQADYTAENIIWNNGYPTFKVYFKGSLLLEITLNVLGKHNIYNSLAAIAVGHQLGLNAEMIKLGIENFRGVSRRLEYKGSYNGIHVYDDIACHPNEINATLEGLRRLAAGNDIYIVLKPNSFTRVKDFIDEFSRCFNENETVIVTDIYAARDIDDGSIHSLDLVKKMKEYNLNVTYLSELTEIREYLSENLTNNSFLLTIGPKDIYQIGEMLLKDVVDKTKELV